MLTLSDNSDIWLHSARNSSMARTSWRKHLLSLDSVKKAAVQDGAKFPPGITIGDVGLNNMGRLLGLERPDAAPFKVREISGCSGLYSIARPLILNASAVNNVMMFSLSCATHIISKKMATEVLDRLMAVLSLGAGD